ncbi:histidine kinase [Nonomuraea sp. NBC_01738]|uniref:sensor histidine kinase n=1 Tax=Nonomuraea sp. NBC_01738 TaxID=2976003 RepID=UPI002E0DDD95|nr:histidine kinase [Nonomuraea sp. NBC_01738]
MGRAGLARGVALGIATLAVVLELTDIWVTAQLPGSPEGPLPFQPEDMAGTAFPVFGAILVYARPRLVVGWLLLIGGAASAVNVLGYNLEHLYGTQPLRAALALAAWQVCIMTLGVLLPLLYPNGRLPGPRWRVVPVAGALLITLDWVLRVTEPELRFEPWWLGVTWAPAAVMAASLLSLALRFVRADAVERRQILWLLVALPFVLVPYFTGFPAWWVASLTIPLVPAAIAIAILRYRLFGIDTLISRALVGTGLAIVITLVYLGAGGVSSVLLAGVDQAAGLAAALFAGAFFQPMRRLLQRGVDRLLYGSVGDPSALAERLKLRLQHTDPGHGLLATLEVLREGLSVTGAAVELDGTTTVSGDLGRPARAESLVWHGEPVGTLLVGATERRRFPAAHDERVLATLTPYIADAAHAVRLTGALTRSRERILTAREEERRRLRRDLHDGLGQSLTGMAMSINAARLTLRTSPEQAERMLTDLRAGMDAVSGDIRQLVYGLRPPALDDLGLGKAIEELAGTKVEVSGELDGLPAAVEVAAYRIAQEALTNARRHAGAAAIRIRLERGESLLLTVTDDGAGLPPGARPGVGLLSMRERAAELGGTCVVRRADEGGTVVLADLPL